MEIRCSPPHNEEEESGKEQREIKKKITATTLMWHQPNPSQITSTAWLVRLVGNCMCLE